MIEIPEAFNLSRQMAQALAGRKVTAITAGGSPHKFAWFYGNRDGYAALATGRTVTGGDAVAGFAQLELGDVLVAFSEGMNVRLHDRGMPRAKKHQLLLEFDDGSALCASAQMYGGAGIVAKGHFENPYYRLSLEKPSPLTDSFTWEHFALLVEEAPSSLSAKGLLATEQRVPGLGNGVLQDILFRARVHPKRKVTSLSESELRAVYGSIRSVLAEMTAGGGRETELDLYGEPGGYRTLMSRATVGHPCGVCGATVEKAPYMGGSVYYCPCCQPL